ncbi:hypothetical protein AAER81_02750, partial [Acinetobacter baumannii]|uniref:hypothetical protein n=1 Tax=Acinetobacter baumannii TaxID=470 RepID=UPI0031F3BC56
LLAVVADKPGALIAFLNAAKPSGGRVTLLASFLVGLKRGVLQTPWKEKATDARWLSLLLRQIAGAQVDARSTEPLV